MNRPLLPQKSSGAPPPPPPTNTGRIVRPRKPVSTACERCRTKKFRCTGERPKCAACSQKGAECVYNTPLAKALGIANRQQHDRLQENYKSLQEAHSNLDVIVRAIQSQDSGQANSIVRMLREGVTPGDIVRHISAGDALAEMHLATETKFRFEFPYRTQMPLEILQSNTPYLRSPIYEVYNAPEQTALWDQTRPQFMKPYHAAEIADSRLAMVLPSQWTVVSQDNVLMRGLLQKFLLHEYAWFPIFHVDHFLDDMFHGAQDYCSPLLVNVILTLACGCHPQLHDRAEYWNPNNLAYKFLAEARRLWDLERNRGPRLTTIQSGSLLNIVYNMQSMDKLGMTYVLQAIHMAQDLGMFTSLHTTLSAKMQNSFGFTAWSLFNWTTLQQYHFMKAPIVTAPPKYPLPDPIEHPSWYGELVLLYPPRARRCSIGFGHLQRARSELSVILLQISTTLWGGSIELRDEALCNFVGETSRRLDGWAKSLPASFAPDQIVYPSHFKLHLPVAKADESSASEAWLNMCLKQADHARINSEVLMRLYYLRHGYQHSDMYITHGLATLAFATLNRLARPNADGIVSAERIDEMRSTVFLMSKGLSDQGKNYYIPYTIFELIKSSLSVDDVRTLLRFLDQVKSYGDTASSRLRSDHVQAQYPVDIVDMTQHPEQKRLGNMIREFLAMDIEARKPQT